MAGKSSKRPTDAELEILEVLWDRGSATVREVFRVLSERRDQGYTTVLKLMQIMTGKGLLVRDTGVRPQVYRAARSRSDTQRLLLGDLVNKAFRGSPGKLALKALSTKKATPEEIKAIRELLDRLEGESS